MADKYVVVSAQVKNDKSGKTFKRGSTVTIKDFPKYVLRHWVEKAPPVLAKAGENGS